MFSSLTVSLCCIIVLAGWAGFNYYHNRFESVPLSRVYDKLPVARNPQKFKEVEAGSTSRIKQSNVAKTKSEISRIKEPSGMLYTWKDKERVTHFSNIAPPQDAVSVQVEREKNPLINAQRWEIRGNEVCVPLTVLHIGSVSNLSEFTRISSCMRHSKCYSIR